MNNRVIQLAMAAVLAITIVCAASAAQDACPQPAPASKTALDRLEGQPVDIAPWAYEWRADRAVQEKPEAYFIPHRLERIDKVYRTAFHEMPEKDLKSLYYQMPDLLRPLPPVPKGRLQAGLLWSGGLSEYQVELQWPANAQKIPSPEDVEVRVYPTSYGWFGWTVDKILSIPTVSSDGHTWTYKSGPVSQMDWAFSFRVDAATEMVAVFYEDAESPGNVERVVPSIRVTSPTIGVWKRMNVELEWGFQAGTEATGFDGRIEGYLSVIGPIAPLAEDKGTTVTGAHSWQSRAVGDTRRGIEVPLLYASGGRSALDSRVTVWTRTSGFTVRIADLENGPVLIPEQGVYLAKAGSGQTARQFAVELAARHLEGIRQMTREHREPASWEELMRKVRLSTCPAGTALPPFPQVEDPPMQVELPDPGWTAAWRAASFQLQGKHMWGGLAFEVGRVAHEMDMVGLHDEADQVYQHFLKAPGAKSEGDFVDGKGALEWATSMRHDMGYSHDGTHASTGRLLFGMADRYFLTGDKEWFERNRERLQAAADWILRQRKLYMKDIPNRQDLLVAGLMPPCMLGDYALPCCDWRWYYFDDAFALQGVQRFADAVAEFDAAAGRKYHAEAEAFRQDIRRAVERDTALAPVRLGRDGSYHSFIPTAAYTGGVLLNLEFGAPQRPQCDVIVGALPLAEPFAALDANDIRMVDTLNVMEEVGALPDVTSYMLISNIRRILHVADEITTSVKSGQALDETWFWNCYGGSFPKASHNANIYLLQDDVPNFLRFWMNSYAAMVGADGKLWEWGHLGSYSKCDAPDNGTAGWFMENFRDLLVMEEGDTLWLARATPRAWLEQGKKISVKNAPTYFGMLDYEIVSDVDNGQIKATIEMPAQNPPQSVILRFRHPKSSFIKSVTVNGKDWVRFDQAKETIELKNLKGRVVVTANY
ncbi:MAG: hypothetical protein M1608_01855 [Candidatus Omnitrophica bacterium]|nr:hypothetical protein [Candidatus Omnitrophota bacterium]